jgi:hypothetical protein
MNSMECDSGQQTKNMGKQFQLHLHVHLYRHLQFYMTARSDAEHGYTALFLF